MKQWHQPNATPKTIEKTFFLILKSRFLVKIYPILSCGIPDRLETGERILNLFEFECIYVFTERVGHRGVRYVQFFCLLLSSIFQIIRFGNPHSFVCHWLTRPFDLPWLSVFLTSLPARKWSTFAEDYSTTIKLQLPFLTCQTHEGNTWCFGMIYVWLVCKRNNCSFQEVIYFNTHSPLQ